MLRLSKNGSQESESACASVALLVAAIHNPVCLQTGLLSDSGLQGRLNVLNQTRVLSGSDYRYGKASSLARDSTVTRQSKCTVQTALG